MFKGLKAELIECLDLLVRCIRMKKITLKMDKVEKTYNKMQKQKLAVNVAVALYEETYNVDLRGVDLRKGTKEVVNEEYPPLQPISYEKE